MKTPDLYLTQILDCLAKVKAYTAEGRSAFLVDTRTQEAVIRNFEVTGEAAKRLADCWANHIGPAPKQACLLYTSPSPRD